MIHSNAIKELNRGRLNSHDYSCVTAGEFSDILDKINREFNPEFTLPSHARAFETPVLSERLYEARAACKRAIAEISMHLSSSWRSGLFRQIDNLLDEDEWDEFDNPVRIESFRTLLRLILLLKPIERPGLGASASGNIIAAWTVNDDRLTIECLPDDSVVWVVSRNVDDGRERAAGQTWISRVPDVLAPYDQQHWLGDDDS